MAEKPFKKHSTKATLRKSKSRRVELSNITKQEKVLAKEMWFVIEQNFFEICKDFYTTLFQRHPHITDYFPASFVNPGFQNPEIQSHMMSLFPSAFRQLMMIVDDEDEARAHMQVMGKWHKDRVKGIKPEDVDALRAVFIDTIEIHLGSKTTSAHMAAMDRLLQASFIIFSDELSH